MAESHDAQQNDVSLEKKLASLDLSSSDPRTDTTTIDLMLQTVEKLQGKHGLKAYKALESSTLPTHLVGLLQLPNLPSSLYALTAELIELLLAARCQVAKQMGDAGVLRALEIVVTTAIPSDELHLKAMESCTLALGNAAHQSSMRAAFTEARSMHVLVELALRRTAPPSVSAKAFRSLSNCHIKEIKKSEFQELIQLAFDLITKEGCKTDYLHFLRRALSFERWQFLSIALSETHFNALLNAMNEEASEEDLSCVLAVVGEICSTSIPEFEALLNKAIFERVVSLSSHSKPSVRRECCWILSNGFAGPHGLALKCLEANGLEAAFRRLATPKEDAKIVLECCWLISNALVHEELIPLLALKEELVPSISILFNSLGHKTAQNTLMEAIRGLLEHHDDTESPAGTEVQNAAADYLKEHCSSALENMSFSEETAEIYDLWLRN